MGVQIYRSIVKDIKSKINSGVYHYGEQLPTEEEFKKIYNTSKSTIRKALKILADEGYVYAIHRKGYFIDTPNTNEYILYFDEVDIGLGIDQTDIISINLISNESNQIKYIPHNKKALEIKSIFRSSEIPVGYDTKYIAYNKGISIQAKDSVPINILDVLSKQIILYHIEKELTISGCKATKEIASNLHINEHEYVIKAEHRYYDRYKKIIAYCVTYYRPSFIKLSANSL
ncbi:MAG: GntR family transcriptional regulator [Eubacteriaceae bacterium]